MTELEREHGHDYQRVKEWMRGEHLIHALRGTNLVNVTRGVALVGGAPIDQLVGIQTERDEVCTKEVAEMIGSPTHLVLMLLDGLGTNVIEEHLDENSFLRTHFQKSVQSVFPATTSAALSSLLTGKYPSQHGLLGWTIRLSPRSPDETILVNPLPFREHLSGKPLQALGVAPDRVFQGAMPTLLDKIPRRSCCFSPYARTTYNDNVTALREQTYCETFEDSLSRLEEFWRSSSAESFAFVYNNEPDSTEHLAGFDSDHVAAVVAEIDRALESLWQRTVDVPGRTLVITADHGHLVVPEKDKLVLSADGDRELLSYLVHGTTVEPRSPCFHVKRGLEEKFARHFRRSRFTEHFALLSAEEAEALELFGPKPMSPLARQVMGNFVAITRDNVALFHLQPPAMVGFHGGMTPAEMAIPLIIAKHQ